MTLHVLKAELLQDSEEKAGLKWFEYISKEKEN